MNAVSVRLARESDADAVAGLTAQLGYQVETSVMRDRLSRLLARPDQQFFVADVGGSAVGWVHVTTCEYVETDAFVVVAGLVVDRRHRRTGIGRMLMQSAEQWAKEMGCSVVRLWSSVGRTGAHRFYEQLEYENIKTQYSFAKSLDAARQGDLNGLVPRIDGE